MAARVAMAGAIFVATLLGLNPPGFAAQTVALAFGLAAASIFPALMMGIFSKRINAAGATIGMLAFPRTVPVGLFWVPAILLAFWIVLWLVVPAGWAAQLVAFGLFRFFDAVKPGPVGWCDRRFKAARGWKQGAGILADDLVAALCTLLVIALWRFVFG